ncbi:hypothetical protein C6341_g13158 [Phytophthora cactorum]|uniref:Integrase catalytic domain-containing protein n=3 Tax=Phytophthora cactorum TaxID=29920 RepID=A0A8T1DU73_9STRA|nr:hypothetical protein PC117_g9166 [Phytophthora cactorum]KAG3162814.1 hypothetical protein C6341_g13158 [Phytophthora cactorum]
MADLLNPEEVEKAVMDSVGEQSEPTAEYEPREEHGSLADEGAEEEKEEETVAEVPVSPVDEFCLDVEQFKTKQQGIVWMDQGPDGFLAGRCFADGSVPTSACGTDAVCSGSSPSYVATVLHYCHADLLSSHLGLAKTTEKVRRLTYWPSWCKDVVEYLRACNKCGSGPFDLLVVDAIGPLPVTDNGNRYILVFVDYFTRWAEAFAVKKLDSVTFVEVMVNGVVARHGIPPKLLSAYGSNFTSEVANSFYQTLGIKKLYGAAYHPQTQGLVERFNGTLIGMLRIRVPLGDPPFFSLYGRDPALPLGVAFLNLGTKWKSNEVAQYRRELYQSLRRSRHLVERQLLKAQDRHERRLDGQVEVKYEVADPVLMYETSRARRVEARTKKLAFSWHGSYRVLSKVGKNAYRIEIPSHPGKVVTVNVNRLKKCRGKWTRPFMDEISAGINEEKLEGVGGPLEESDLPSSSFAERLTVGREDTVIARVDAPLLETVLMSAYTSLVTAYKQSERKKNSLSEFRRSARLADANAMVDEDTLLMA